MVNQSFGYYQSENQEKAHQPLYYTLYEPEGQPVKATLLILHGMAEHSGRYAEFSEVLANQGICILAYDHLGHGKTAKNNDDLGFFRKKRPADCVLNDAEDMAGYLEKQHPGVPHFVLGHSMGSFIARCILQNSNGKFDGAIIMGTGGREPGARFAKIIFSILNKISSKRHNRFAQDAFNKMSSKKFSDEEVASSVSWISENESNREAYLEDDLTGIPFTNNGFYTVLSLNVKATKRKWAKKIPENFPFLFVSGADDPVGNFGKGVRQAVDNLQSDGFNDVSLELYEGMRHEILNESIKEQVYLDILNWIDDHLS